MQGAPELEQLRQRVIATHHLEAMDADEVEPYVIHRLQRAGWTGRPQLTPDAFAALYDETGGVPRKLNALMNRALLMGAVEQLETLNGDLISAVIADMTGKRFAYEAPLSDHAPAEAIAHFERQAAADVAKPTSIAAAAPAATAAPAHSVDQAAIAVLHSRIERLETHMVEQDAVLRRVLAMLIDWMEKENQTLAGEIRSIRAA